MAKIKHLLLIDTEFVSSKKGGQPFQVGFIEYENLGGTYVRVGEFNLHIRLKKGIRLNIFAREITGVSEEILEQNGLPFEFAKNEVINYLLKFPFDETLIVGWDHQGDRRMMNLLINDKEEIFDINAYQWYDVMKIYKKHYTELKGQNPSLTSACEHFNFETTNAHDALADAEMTGRIFFKILEDIGESVAFSQFKPQEVNS